MVEGEEMPVLFPLSYNALAFATVEYQTFGMPDLNPHSIVHLELKRSERGLMQRLLDRGGFHVFDLRPAAADTSTGRVVCRFSWIAVALILRLSHFPNPEARYFWQRASC